MLYPCVMKVSCKLAKLLEVSDFLALLKEKGKPRLVTVDYEAKLQDAIKIMIEREFSQLPVEKDKNNWSNLFWISRKDPAFNERIN